MKRILLFSQIMLLGLLSFNSASAQYCTPEFSTGCTGGDGITSFQLGTINQVPILCDGSPISYYHDFTSLSTDLAQNGIYDISVQTYNPGMYVSVWIDYNSDQEFDNGSELALQIFCIYAGTTSTSFTVPESASLGGTRLRLLSSTNAFPTDPCSDPGFGNCFDFAVNIIDPVTPPSVNTLAATNVTASDAMLNGAVNANGNFTHAVFNFGTDAGYGTNLTANPWVLTGNSNTDVTAVISGLTPNTTYHYEAVGYGAGGSVSGGDMEFTTVALPPTVVTYPATGISGVSATLSGMVNANNSETSVVFEYGLTDSYGSALVGIPSVVTGYYDQYITAVLTGLEMNTTYHYRISSVNSEGTSAGGDMTFTTLLTPYCIPVYSTGCTEYGIGLTYFELNTLSQTIPCEGTPSYYHDYTASSTDLALNGMYTIAVAAGYGFPGNPTAITVWIDYNQNNIFDGESEAVGHVNCYSPGTTYSFVFSVSSSVTTGTTRLRAMAGYMGSPSDPCGSYSYGNCADFDVNIVDAVAPPSVTTLAATEVTASDAVLNGMVNANDNTTFTAFHFGLDASLGNTIEGNPASVSGNSNTDISTTLNGLMPNSTYYYAMVGYGSGGFVSGDTITFITSAAPPVVTTGVATNISGVSALLTGTVIANNLSSSVSFEYGLTDSYGSTVEGVPPVVTGNNPEYVAASIYGLELNTLYHYRVFSANSEDTSWGDDMTFTTLSVPYCIPVYNTGCSNYNIGLTSFELGTIVQSIPCEGTPSYYHDYTSLSTDLALNGYYSITVEEGGYGAYMTVWIDYNQNSVFDGFIEIVGQGYCGAGSSSVIPITIPEAVPTGSTRLRIMSSYYQYPGNACGVEDYGNCADFSVNIVDPLTPPTVVTLDATGVLAMAAVLNGTVNANDISTQVVFNYGLDTGYGNTVAGTPGTVTGTATTDISADLSGLMPNATYHFRIRGFGAGGSAFGDDLTFATTALPPTVVTGSVTNLSGSTATLHGSVNANNSLSFVSFEFGLDESYGTVISGNPSFVNGFYNQSIMAELTGLDLNTTYHYRIISTNASGTSLGDDFTFTTYNTPYCIPSFTTGCGNYNIGLTYFGLNTISQLVLCEGTPSYYHDYSASASTDLARNGYYSMAVTAGYGYESYPTSLKVWIDYNQNDIFDGESEVVGTVNCYLAGETYTIPFTVSETALIGPTGLRVMATYNGFPSDPCGWNYYGNCSDFTVNINEAVTPPSVTTLAASAITAFDATLNGAVNANDNATQVEFHYGLDVSYGNTIQGVPGTVTGNSTTDVSASVTGLEPNTTYNFMVVGMGAGGNISGGNMAFTTNSLPPTVSTGAAATITGASAILNGTVNANNLASTVSFEYGLTDSYGSTVTAVPSAVSGYSVQAVTGHISGLALNTTYHYRIVSTNSAGTSSGGDMTFTTLPTPYCIPAYSYGCAYNIGIAYFGLNTISQTISCTGTPSYYHDFTASSTDLALNGYYAISVQRGGTYAIYVTVWIDYNQNNIFDGATEIVGQGYCGTAAVTPIYFTVPATAATGSTRLRVMARYYNNGYPSDPCSLTEQYGNCNDFTVNIIGSATAPAVTTLAATGITSSGAVLNGAVNANDNLTQVVFHYGTTPGYGTTVAGVPGTVSGSSTTDVAASISGLLPNTTYYFEVVGFGAGGYVSGGNMTFTSQAVPPVATTTNATNISGTTATLRGTVNANYLSSEVSFEYGLTTSYGDTISGSPSPVTGGSAVAVTGAATGLLQSTTYHFRAIGTNTSGSGAGGDMTFTTLSPTTTQAVTTPVPVGTINQQIIGIEILNPTSTNSVQVTSFTFNTNGCTQVSDLSRARLYSTGTSGVFSTAIQFGPEVTAFGALGSSFTITGTRALSTGNNYFWLTYDISPGATAGSQIDAECTSITAGGSTMVPAIQAPVGNRLLTSEKFLQSITVTQASTAAVQRGSADNEILLLDFTVGGTTGTLPLNSIVVANTGYDSDISANGVKLYQTSTSVFATTNPIGTAQSFSAKSATFSSLSVDLPVGHTYVWVAYDIAPDAIGFHMVDGKITQNAINVQGLLYPATEQNPVGNRFVRVDPKVLPLTEDAWATIPPLDWNKVGSSWAASGSSLSGGVSPELRLSWSGAYNNDKMITPPLITTGLPYLVLRFKTFLNNYGYGATLRVQSSSDGSTWTNEAWSMTQSSGGNFGPYNVVTPISSNLSGGVAQVAFTVTGNPYYINYWYIDNVIITGPQPPTVTTTVVTSVTGTTAISGGNVTDDAANAVTERGVCWGTSADPTTAGDHTVDGSGLGVFVSNITGLVPGNTYHYRAYATNGIGTSYGTDLTFTPAPDPTVLTTSATDITGTEAVLNGIVNANGGSVPVTFEYGLTATYGSTLPGVPDMVTGNTDTPVSASLSGLQPNTAYHYRAVGSPVGGTVINGEDMTFSTNAIPPSVVTTSATLISGASAVLNGTVIANNSTSSVSFEYGLTTAYGSSVSAIPASIDGNTVQSVSASILGLDLNTTYHYRISSTNSAGTAVGDDMAFTTLITPYCIPAYSTGCNSYNIGLTHFELGSINQAITCTGTPNYYHDFTTSSTDLYQNGAYVISVTSGYWDTYLSVWIDYNQDNIFDVASETAAQVYCTTPGTVYTIPFTVSTLSSTGTTRLRAMANYYWPSYNYPADPCTLTETYGNCSDFTVNILSPLTSPSVTTDAASGITATEAVLNGTVNANGYPTNVVFNWGLTNAYGTITAGVPGTVAGSSDTPVAASLSGLTPNSTYHYLAKASGIGGTVSGTDMTFATTAIPPSVTTGTVTSIQSTIATLHGTVNANNLSSSVYFEYGLTTSYGSTIAASPSTFSDYSSHPVTGSVTGLALNTLYHYRIVSTNSAGTSAGDDMTFTSAPTYYCIPAYSYGCNDPWSYHMGLTFFGLNTISQTITCSGTPDYYHNYYPTSTDLNKNGNYSISVHAGGSYGLNVTVWIDYNQSNVFDGGIEIVGQGHCGPGSSAAIPFTVPVSVLTGSTGLRVISEYDGYSYPASPCGTYNYGNSADFMVNIIPAVTPASVTTNSASGITPTEAVLNGTVNANGYVADVSFNYGLTASYGTTVAGTPSPVTGSTDTPVSASITGLLPNTLYHFRAAGSGVGGNVFGNDVTFTTNMIPPTVTTTSATNIAGVSANLNGTVNPNNLPSSVSFEYGLTDSYGTTVDGNPVTVSGSTAQVVTSFISGLTMNTTYHYRVISTNSEGTSYGSDMTFATLPTLYCIPTYEYGCSSPWNMGLTYVELNTISQTIACTGTPSYYHDYTSSSTDLALNGSYSMTVQAGGGYGVYINVWIDINQNNYFDGAGEIVGQGHCNGGSSSSISLTIPGTSLTGATRLRVMSNFDSYGYPADPCGWNYYGNCADFSANIMSPGPPIVYTGAATQINVSSATLNGLVNANYFSSTVSFDYGLTDSYGSTIAASPSSLGGGVNTAVTAALTGLTLNTTYHFRVSSTNSAGTSVGDDLTFTTTPTAVFTVTGGGTYCSYNSGLSVGLDGSDAGATYQLYKNAVAYGSTIPGTGNPLVWDNLTDGTYTVEAITALGNTMMLGNAVISSFSNPVSVYIYASASTICPGSSVTFTAYIDNGGTNPVYQWKVNGSDVGTNSNQYVYAPSSGDQILCVLTSNVACPTGNPATSNTITINVSSPVPAIAGSNLACVGSSGNSYSTEFGMSNYIWNVSAGGTITSGGNGYYYVTVTWNTAGNQTVSVNYTNSYGCTAVSPTVKNIAVNVVPVPTIAGPATVCAGSSGNVYTTESGMMDYTWAVPGGTITSGLGTNQITVTWNSSGTQTVSVNYSNGCTAVVPTEYYVTVNPLSVPGITGPTAVCVNSAGNIYATEAGMSNYSWSISTGGTVTAGGSATDNTVTVTWNTSGSKTIHVSYTNTFSCGVSSPGVINVTVSPLPVPVIAGPAIVCGFPSAGNVYSTEAGKTNYVWTVSAGGTVTAGGTTSDNTVTITWNSAGPESVGVNYTDLSNCNAAGETVKAVTVYPVPTPSITGASLVCLSSSGFTYTTESGKSNYSWTVSAGGTITSGGGSSNSYATIVWNTTGAQTVSVNYDNATGCSAPSAYVLGVTVNPRPVPSLAGPTPVCAGSTGNIYTTDAGMTDYAWAVSYGGTITAGGTATDDFVAVTWNVAGARHVSVNYSNSFGCAAVSSTVFNVSVDARPVPVITGDGSICGIPSAGNVYSTESGMTGYAWTVSAGGTITGGDGTNAVTVIWATTGSKTLAVTYTDDNGCTPSVPTVKNINVEVIPVPSVSGPALVCGFPSMGNVYTTETGKSSYEWTVSAGGTITSGSGTYAITVTWASAGPQTVTVNYVTGIGCTPVSPTVLDVDVFGKPLPTVTGPSTICGTPSPGNVYVSEAGMTNYAWTVSGGTITAGSGSNSITVNWTSPGARYVRLIVTDGNGCSSNQVVYNVDVYALPVPVIAGDASVCDPPSAGHDYSTEAGMSGYAWNVSAGGTVTGGLGTNTITVTWNTIGNQSVDVTYTDTHGCTPAAPTVKNVKVDVYFPVSVTIAASANPTCSGSYVTFTASPVNGGSSPAYQWKVNGANVGWNASSYWYIPSNGDVVSCVLNSNLLCSTGNPATSNSVAMVVNAHPDAPASGGDQTVCSTTLPALLSATAPAGSTVDWYSYASGGALLLSNSAVYSASSAGNYYAESRDLATGCKSISRTTVNLAVNTAVQYFIDLDGDGYGNPEISVMECAQPAGYVLNALDCNDNNPNINPGSQYLAYTGNVGFTNSIVTPVTGSPYTLFHFEADYFDATNSLPGAGYPRLILDYEGNGSYTDANDRTVLMTGADPLDISTVNGKRYFAEVNGLPYGTNWKARVMVSDGVNCTTIFGPFNYPDVLHEPNIYLFANDITFSDPHPDPSQNITVSAVVHNESDFDAQDFVCHLINQWDTLIAYPDVTVANIPAHQTYTVQWNIATPAVPAWCPMQVVIDYTNAIAENNELDNSAVRPFVNGNYQIAGAIVVQSAVSPPVSYSNQYYYLSLHGRAWYTDLAVQLTDSTVAGATVDFTIVETGATYTGYTNSWGYFNIYFPAPVPPGTYHISASVTDFTLTGNFTNEFTILPPVIPETKPNLTVNYCHSVSVEPVNPQYDPLNPENVSLFARVVNNGNATAVGPIEVRFTYSTGGTWLTQYDGDLNPGHAATVSVSAPIPPPTDTQLVAYVDPNDLVAEWNESDADNSTIDYMCYDFQPVGICGGNFWGTHCVNSSTGIYVGLNVYHLYDASPVAVQFEVSGPGIAGWQNLGVGTLSYATRNCYCPYVVGIPEPFTYTELGVYTFRITVDPGNDYAECDEANNELIVTVNSVPCLPPETKPDLVFTSCYGMQVEPVNPFFPGMATLVANIANYGNATAIGPIDVQFTYSEGTFTGTYSGNLNPGQSARITVSAPLPAPATTTLTAYIDPSNTVSEWSETNNVSTDDMCWEFQPVPHCGANFWSHSYIVGQSATLAVGLNVQHLYDANPVKVKFEVSGPGIAGTQNLGFGLLNNVTRNCWCPWVVVLPMPYTFFEAGVYHFTMTADPEDIYTECNEANNVFEVDVIVHDGADMRILSQFINPTPLNPDVNDSVSLIITYENIGNTNVNDQMKLKVKVDNTTLDEIYPVYGLATGDHASIAIPTKWASDLPGAHVIRAIIDADNQVPEINESNNEATRAIIVGECANLYFQFFESSKSNPLQGENISINSRIGNNGDVNAAATVKFYYIGDSFDTIPIGQTSISVLKHDSTTLVWPWAVVDNSTTLVAKITDVNTQEFNPDDNMATTVIGGFVVSISSVSACINENNGTLTAEATGGTAPYLYIWSNGYIGHTLTAGAGDYAVTVTDNTGLSKMASGTITEFPPLVPVISGPSISSVNLTGNVYTTEPGMTGYLWTVSAGGTITSGGTSTDNTVTVTWTVTGKQTVSVNYATPQGCTAAVATNYDVDVYEVIAPTISGPERVCVNSSGNEYLTEQGMSGYAWAVSAGGVITGGGTASNNFVLVTWTSAGPQTVSVSYVNQNETTTPVTDYSVTVVPQPVPIITGPVSICANSTGHIYTTEAGMSEYAWAVSSGGTITAGNTPGSPTITVSWAAAGSRTVSVSYTDVDGCTAASPTILNVTVNPLPAAIAGNARGICLNTSTTIGAAAVAGSTYSWYSNPAGFTSTLANPTVTPLVNTTYTVTETVTSTGCENRHSVLVKVNPIPAAIAGDSRTICKNSSTTLGAPGVAGSIYSWSSVPAGFTSPLPNPTVTPATTTTYTVMQTAISTGCSNSNSVVITVNPVPVPTLSGPTPVCNKSTGNTYTTEASMSNYLWIIPSGAVVTGGGTTSDNYVTITWNSTGTRTIKVNYTNAFGCSAPAPKTFNVTVNPAPVPAITGSSSGCINTDKVYSTVPLQSNYSWTISPDGVIVSGQGTKTVVVMWTAPGEQWVGLNYSNASGCSAPAPTIKNVTVTSCKSMEILPDSAISTFNGKGDIPGLEIYPNPNDGSFTAIISVSKPGTYNLQLFSNLGVMVYELKDLYVSGTIKQKIEVTYVANSIYTLVLTNKDQTIQKKVLIRK